MKYAPSSTCLRTPRVVLLCLGLQAAAAAAATPRVALCSWDRPGNDPFMGNVVAAIDRYTDIPADVRARLRQRMAQRRYDDLVSIRRDSIEGGHRYDPAIRDMHFGAGTVCAETSRARWTAQMHERGLVYCDSGHCILVPTICRNVSRIARSPAAPVAPPLLFVPPVVTDAPSLDGDTFIEIATAPPQPPLGAPPDRSGGGSPNGAPGPFGGPVPFGAPVPFGGPASPPPRPSVPPSGDGSTWEHVLPVRTVPFDGTPVTAVPEPATAVLLLAGLAWLALRRR